MGTSNNQRPLVCLPGQRLCMSNNQHMAGSGTYERGGYIFASLAGVVDKVPRKDVENTFVLEVHMRHSITVPTQGDIVTAQVHSISQQACKCWIKCVGDSILRRPFRAVLRKEDIRATEKDKVDVYRSFRPGDVILARVLPITEAHTYQLSTSENELGVVTAHSEYGYPMVPISWNEMQCSKTFVKENRKVARIVPESIHKTLNKDLKPLSTSNRSAHK